MESHDRLRGEGTRHMEEEIVESFLREIEKKKEVIERKLANLFAHIPTPRDGLHQ